MSVLRDLIARVKKLLFSFRRPEVLAALAAVSVVSVVFLTFSLPSLPVFLTRERALSGAVPDNVARVVGCPEALRGVRFRPGTNRSDVSVVGGRDLTYGKLLERWTAALSDAEEHQRISRCLPEDFQIPQGSKDDSTWQQVPLAFSVVAHSNLAILTRILHLLFRPRHAFCLYVDAKAEQEFKDAVRDLVECYRKLYPDSQVFLAPSPRNVYWGHISIPQADLDCLNLLLAKYKSWNYYLNLAGSELPRFSVERLEHEVSTLSNLSMVDSKPTPHDNMLRHKFVHKLRHRSQKDRSQGYYEVIPRRTIKRKGPPPHNLKMYKGIRNVVINRTFSEFVLRHKVSNDLLEFLSDTVSPVEHFFSTLIRVRVSETGKVTQDLSDKFNLGDLRPRYTMWHPAFLRCKGIVIRGICIFSFLDLPSLVQLEHRYIVLNKFGIGTDALAVQCWTERVATLGD